MAAPSPETAARFPAQTAWTLVLEARDPGSPERRLLLERLAALYWPPVCAHLRRRWNLGPDDAADLTQEFFVRFLDGDFLREASPERGRFRTFLKLRLRDLVVDDLRKRSALKRGGGERIVPLGAEGVPEPRWTGLRPEEAFDREWASALLAASIREVEADLAARGQDPVFLSFRHCALLKPAKTYRDCAALLGIKESDVRNHVFKTRQLLQESVRRHVRESVLREAEAEDELAYLLGLLDL